MQAYPLYPPFPVVLSDREEQTHARRIEQTHCRSNLPCAKNTRQVGLLIRQNALTTASFHLLPNHSCIALIFSPSKNMCSVRQRPIPTAPVHSTSHHEEYPHSYLQAGIFIGVINSAKSPESSAAFRFYFTVYTTPVLPFKRCNHLLSEQLRQFLQYEPYNQYSAPAPDTQHLPILRATTAA